MIKNKNFDMYFEFDNEWNQLIETLFSEKTYFNWYDITFITLSIEYIDYTKFENDIEITTTNLLFEDNKDIERKNKTDETGIKIGFLGFVCNIYLSRYEK